VNLTVTFIVSSFGFVVSLGGLDLDCLGLERRREPNGAVIDTPVDHPLTRADRLERCPPTRAT
jgi:hypothetical protein